MKHLIIFFAFLALIGISFALPITINTFTSESPLYEENQQKNESNDYAQKENADFGTISKKNELSEYNGTIEHIFTHCLIAYPDLANSTYMGKYYQNDCITSSQFAKILDELYKNNYILIDINSIFEEKDGLVKKKTLYLPKNKKPLIFSFDDVVYDQRKMKTGMVDKIAINANNEIVSETFENWKNGSNKIIQSKTQEFVSILEDFVSKHPDFSFNNAKGTICLTGFDGILGYRTSSKNTDSRDSEIEKATQVVNKLKENGWNFACHSYGHYHMKKISDEKFKEELDLWQKEVEPIIGKTNVYVYPYGEWEIFDENNNYSQKHIMLQNAGFKLFCGVGIQNFYGNLPLYQSANKVLFMDRTPIDGYTITHNKEKLKRLFDASKVWFVILTHTLKLAMLTFRIYCFAIISSKQN